MAVSLLLVFVVVYITRQRQQGVFCKFHQILYADEMQGTEHQLTMAATHCHLSTLLSPPLTKQVLKTGAFANLRGNSVKFPPLQVRKDDHKKSLVTRPMVSSVGESHTLTDSNQEKKGDIGIVSIHHVGLLCENLEKSLDFYQNLLGLEINKARPHDKLPYRGAWLWVGSEMIHLMELPNPDPLTGRPEHGGRDRHACIAIKNVTKLKDIFDQAGINYTLSRSGRPAIFARDPDGNALEFTQVD